MSDETREVVVAQCPCCREVFGADVPAGSRMTCPWCGAIMEIATPAHAAVLQGSAVVFPRPQQR